MAIAEQLPVEAQTPVVEHDHSLLTRLRATVALLVLLTLVGAAVALLIGTALFLVSVAIRNTVG